eukprot:931036-Pleurochrysis_carterae.AAC.1
MNGVKDAWPRSPRLRSRSRGQVGAMPSYAQSAGNGASEHISANRRPPLPSPRPCPFFSPIVHQCASADYARLALCVIALTTLCVGSSLSA